MPAIAVAAVAGGVGYAVAGAIGGGVLGAVIGGIAGAGTSMVLGSALGLGPKKPPQASAVDETARGILLNAPANDASIPVIYGRRRVGGTTVLLEVGEESAGRLSKIVVLSEGEIRDIFNVYLDDQHQSEARIAQYTGIEEYVGTDTQAASALLTSELPSKWTSAHQGKGVAYIYARLFWNADAWRGEPVITADVLGRLLYDPRNAGSPTVYSYSNNPALVIRDYLTNVRYGRGIPEDAIDSASFIAAANHCEERVGVPALGHEFTVSSTEDYLLLSANTPIGHGDGVELSTTGSLPGGLAAGVTYYAIPKRDNEIRLATSYADAMAGTYVDISGVFGSGTHTITHIDQARYTVDGVLDTARPPLDNLRDLLTACRGYLVFSGGLWKLGIDQASAATGFVFDEDNIVGAWSIQAASKSRRFNRVTAKFFNPARQWQPDFAIQESATYRDEDNGLVLETEVDLPFTADPYRAARIAQMEMRQSRLGLVARFRATIAALRCEVGDVVEITHSTPGWTLKKFRIQNLVLRGDDEVEVTAREYDVGVYSLDALSAVRTAPATSLPNPFDDLDITVGVPVSGTAELFVAGDGTVVPRIRLPFTEPDNGFLKYYECQFARASGSPQDWQDAPDVASPANNAYFYPVEDGVAYDLRIRAVTSVGNAGEWAYARGHSVAGKTAVPSDVTGASAVQTGGVVVMGVDSVADADLDLIEVRLHDGGQTDWENATPIGNILRGQTVTSAAISPGTWELLFKAKDTSGNYSENTSRVTITVTSEGFTVIETQESAPDWLGAKTNMVEHWTGKLIPDSTKAANQHTNAELFEQFVPYPQAECYFEAPTIDKGIDATARIYADIISTLGRGVTSGIAAPAFQVDTRLDAGSFDGFETWTVGSANFRHLKGRIFVDTSIGKPVISGFAITVDAEAREERFPNQVIGAGGTALSFTSQFHNTDYVIAALPIGATTRIPRAAAKATGGYTQHLDDAAGVSQGGTADITVRGV